MESEARSRERRVAPVFQATIPFPLARLYTRAHHAKGARESHDYAFHLLEASLKLSVAALIAEYRRCGERSDEVDPALRHLAMPSLGQWCNIFKRTLLFLAGRSGDDSFAVSIYRHLTREDGALGEIFAALAKAMEYAGRISTRVNAIRLVDFLPAYRNAMSDAHGSIRADPGVYSAATPALLSLARFLLEDGALFGGGRLVFAEDVKIDAEGERRVVWMDLQGLAVIRRKIFEGEITRENTLPGRLYLELESGVHLPLYPLIHFVPGDMVDQVFYLNRARGGRGGIQFLCYSTGEFYAPGRDPQGDNLVRGLEELLSWVTAREIDARAREELAAMSDSDAQAAGMRPPGNWRPDTKTDPFFSGAPPLTR